MDDLTEQQMMDMSDEDIMNMSQPPAMPAPEAEANDPATDGTDGQETPVAGLEDAPSGSEETPEGDDLNEDTPNGDKDENPLNQSDEDLDAAKSKEKPKAEEKSKDKTPETDVKLGEEEKATADSPPDYKKFFEQITGEFKASGSKMKVQTAEEAVALMQRGVDYTRKMQALKPSLKIMKMLENNGLLDEAKLSHFIDLDKKDPAAIAKFLKDKQVDPLDLDMSGETQYKPGNHAVSDEEMRFNSVLEDVQSTPTGRETIQITGTKHERDLQKQGAQAQANQDLEVTKALLKSKKPEEKPGDVEAAVGFNQLSKSKEPNFAGRGYAQGGPQTLAGRQLDGAGRINPSQNISSKYYDPSTDPALNPANNLGR